MGWHGRDISCRPLTSSHTRVFHPWAVGCVEHPAVPAVGNTCWGSSLGSRQSAGRVLTLLLHSTRPGRAEVCVSFPLSRFSGSKCQV